MFSDGSRTPTIFNSRGSFALIGHPRGGPKALSLITDMVYSNDGLTYDGTKSRPGSSGSPVVALDDQYCHIVGFMHYRCVSHNALSVDNALDAIRRLNG